MIQCAGCDSIAPRIFLRKNAGRGTAATGGGILHEVQNPSCIEQKRDAGRGTASLLAEFRPQVETDLHEQE